MNSTCQVLTATPGAGATVVWDVLELHPLPFKEQLEETGWTHRLVLSHPSIPAYRYVMEGELDPTTRQVLRNNDPRPL